MESGTRISRWRGAAFASAVAAAGLVAAMWAPAPGLARGDRFYQGPTESAPYKGTYQGVVRMRVQFAKLRQRAVATAAKSKRVPVFVTKFEYRAIPFYCPDGSTTIIGNIDEAGNPRGFDKIDGMSVRKRKFNFDEQATLGEDGIFITQLSGRIPRRGAATGTIRVAATHPSRGGLCDTGVVSWSAPRVSSLSEPAP